MTIFCSSNTEIWYANIQKGNTDCVCDAVILGVKNSKFSHWESKLRVWWELVHQREWCLFPTVCQTCSKLALYHVAVKTTKPHSLCQCCFEHQMARFFLHLWKAIFPLASLSWLDMMPKNHLPCYHLSRRCLRFIIAHLSMVFSGVHNKFHCPFCVLLKLAYSGTPILQTTLSILDIPVAFIYEMKNVSLQLWAYPAVPAKSPYQFQQKYCPMMLVIKGPAFDIFNFCNRQRWTLLIHAIY